IILRDEIVEIVVGLENDVASAPAVAAAGAALGSVLLALERDAAFSAVPRPRVNFYFVNEHTNKKGEARASPWKSSSALNLPPAPLRPSHSRGGCSCRTSLVRPPARTTSSRVRCRHFDRQRTSCRAAVPGCCRQSQIHCHTPSRP